VRRAAATALGSSVLILAAFAFDASVLFVPGVAGLLISSLVPPWVWLSCRGASVRRSLNVERVVEDQPLEARIGVRRGRLGLPGGEILDPLVGGPVSLAGMRPSPGGDRTTELRVVARFPRRGAQRLAAPELILRDPLGLVRVVHRAPAAAHTVLVLPRTERVRWVGREGAAHLDRPARAASLEALAATELDGLRPYRPGTSASRISWPALARGAGLLERRLRAERGSGPLVALDVRCLGSSELVDAVVRAAASLALELALLGGCDLLLPGDRRPVHIGTGLGAWPAAHERLAVLEGGADAVPPSLSSSAPNRTIFYASAQRDRLPTSVTHGGRVAVLVLPIALTPAGGPNASFEVCGCRGYLLADSRRGGSPAERAA
jgi:uncharacterized protein (DUF58 family)